MKNMILTPVEVETLVATIAKEVVKELATASALAAPHQSTNDELLTRREAAQLLTVSLVTLGRWSKDGTIKGHRIGRRVRYKRSELLSSLKQIRTNNSK